MGVAGTFRATISYDGTDFSGWQIQADRRTVQGVLEEALTAVLGARTTVVAAGRTDAGVHAEGQVVSFRAATGIPPEGIAAAANARLPEDVSILDLRLEGADFHATFSATGKVYRYEILSGRARRPLRRRTSWRVASPLDLRRMRTAAALLVGRRDFRSFRTNPGIDDDRGTTIRHLRRLDIRRSGDRILLEFEGDGFLYNMVRAIVGTLVQVGRGTWTPGRVGEALRAKDRGAGGPTAPPQGLTLVSVSYPEEGERLPRAARRARRITGMNVRFTGRHVGIGEADRAYAEKKISALGRFHRGIEDVEVRVMMDGAIFEKVELQADLGHCKLVSAAESPSFRPAFDKAVEVLKRQILKDKERVVDRRRRAAPGKRREA